MAIRAETGGRAVPCEECAIRGRTCVRDLDDGQLAEFRSLARPVVYKPRQLVFHETMPAAALFIVCRGAVKLYHAGACGRESTLAIALPGDVIGEIPPDESQPYSVSAETLCESQLCCLTRGAVERLVRLNPMAGMRLLGALSRSLADARRKVRSLALKGAESRLAEILLSLSGARVGDDGSGDGHREIHVHLQYSRRELADIVGVSTETAIRLLGRLRDRGLIEVRHRTIVIRDPHRLACLASRHTRAKARREAAAIEHTGPLRS